MVNTRLDEYLTEIDHESGVAGCSTESAIMVSDDDNDKKEEDNGIL